MDSRFRNLKSRVDFRFFLVFPSLGFCVAVETKKCRSTFKKRAAVGGGRLSAAASSPLF